MKVEFIGHASILIETNGLRILSDPWWEGPCFGAQWWIHPEPCVKSVISAPLDYVYISHGHHDHLHLGTLKRHIGNARVLVTADGNLAQEIEDAGIPTLTIGEDEAVQLSQNVHCRIMPSCSNDTLMVVDDGSEVCANLNDAVHAAPESVKKCIIDRLKELWPRIDYVFCGYGIASHFPCCYQLPNMDRVATAAKRQHYFNKQWVDIIARLNPKFGFPFAADVMFLDANLTWANEPIHNSERPTDLFLQRDHHSDTTVIDIAPGFTLENREITQRIEFEPFDLQKVETQFPDKVAKANRVTPATFENIDSVAKLLRDNITLAREYLLEYRGNYRFFISFTASEWGIALSKKGASITVEVYGMDSVDLNTYDIVLYTRYSYLRRSLTHKYGNEVLFVGSGCQISYNNIEHSRSNLHQELTTLLRKMDTPPRSRFGDQPRYLFQAKRLIKSLIGHKESDLYDLDAWIVHE